MHVFEYLRAFPDYGIKFYADTNQSSIHEIYKQHDIPENDIIAFSNSSW